MTLQISENSYFTYRGHRLSPPLGMRINAELAKREFASAIGKLQNQGSKIMFPAELGRKSPRSVDTSLIFISPVSR